MRQDKRRIEFIRARDTGRTADWLKGEKTLFAFHGLEANFYILKTKKIPAGSMTLGDWLGCYLVSTRVGHFCLIRGQEASQ